ncbi:MAG: ribosome maturation factor RimP [Candidatus Omnitrophica bacterium]|nr:ribosome maturation factor RimP [Candidatus Omnitrophota bacterium]
MCAITEKVNKLICNLLQDKGIELVDISYKRRGPDMVLSLVLDKKGGITIDECGCVNEQVGELIDKENIINERYLLEVASPGLDRALKTKKDFEWATGKLIRINTYGPVEDKREHIGKVISCDGSAVIIELTGRAAQRCVPMDKISKARLEINFKEK